MKRKAYKKDRVVIIGDTAKLKVAFPSVDWNGLVGEPGSSEGKPVKETSRKRYPGAAAITVKAHTRRRPSGISLPKQSPMPGKNFYVDIPATTAGTKGRTFTFTYVGTSTDLWNALLGDKAPGSVVRNEYGRPLSV